MVRASLAAAAAAVALLVGWPARSPAEVAEAETLHHVLEQARQTTRLIEGRTRVRQLYRVRALGLEWEFSAWVTKGDDAIEVHTEGAPWFIPEELTLAPVEVFDLLEGYEPALVGKLRPPGGADAWVVEARPRPPGDGGPPSGGARLVRFWVEEASGLVTHLELAYWWGQLVIDQTYRQVGPYRVLDTQYIRVNPGGIVAEVRYSDYQFGT